MTITNFIPQVWNAQLLLDFRANAVAANSVNRGYQGDATRGNTVKITSAVNVAIANYKAAGRVTTASAADDTGMDLLIDQEKSFDFFVDDIDRAQAAGSFSAYTQSAAEGLVEDADKFILAMALTGALAANVTAAGAAITTGDAALNVIRDLRKLLNKQNVPQSNRVAFVNAEFEAILLEASSKLTQVDKSGSPAGLREATIGRVLGFDIVNSENLPNVAKPQILAYHTPSVAYVSQVQETEALRAENKFADRLRGLHVYGGRVLRPKAIAAWTSI